MRIFKSLLVLLIGLTALMYALQNLANIGLFHQEIDALPPDDGSGPRTLFSASHDASWTGFALVTLSQLAIAVVALKGAWELYAARGGTAEEYKQAKTTAVWAGALSLLGWFILALLVGGGLFHWGTDSGAAALSRSFQLSSTSALTILFVWGTTD